MPFPASLLARVLEMAVAIQQIPAPTGAEAARADFVQARFAAEGLETTTDAVGNVYARLPGQDPDAPPLVISAHLDTVFPADTPLTLRREGDRLCAPGIGDNSVAVAALFALAWLLPSPLPADLWLVANVGEEGLGNLKGMKAVVARFGGRVRAYLVLEGLGLGWIYPQGLGVRRYAISVETAGGHAWGDAGAPSAVHILADLVARLAARPLPPRTSLNVGTFHGGVSVNTIAPRARVEIDLRAVAPRDLERLAHGVESEALRVRRKGVGVYIERIGDRPAGHIPASHPLVQAALAALQKEGIRGRLAPASTDANIPLSRGYPAICLGLTHGGGAHTTAEFIETASLAHGLAALVRLVQYLLASPAYLNL